MPKKKSSGRSLWSAKNYTYKQSLIGALALGLVGVFFVFMTHASQGQGPIKKFVENPKAGMHWAGLNEKAAGACAKALEISDKNGKAQGCTHGPDPAPAGLDATVSVQPLSTGDSSTAAATGFPCDGDGVTGKRVQMVYAHASDKADRFSQYVSSFSQYASNMNGIFVESGNQTGSARSVRFVTNTDCSLNVINATLTATGDDSFGNMKSELISQGLTRSDRKYVVWADASVYCGISNVTGDTQPGAANANNNGPTFSRVDSGCWGGTVETHELTHALGGVQLDAPHTNNGWHCYDESDRMCYDDGSGVAMKSVCPSSEENRLDCNKDDYFNTSSSIPSTNYLSTHWNVANSAFLIVGTGTVVAPPPSPTPTPTPPPPAPTPTPTPPPPTPPPVPTDTTLPTVSVSSPINGSKIGSKVTVKASGSDNIGVVKMEIYIDGQLRTTTTTGSISANWNSRRASLGQHTILVKAYDAAGNVGQTSVIVYK